jgi:hypothetical protein
MGELDYKAVPNKACTRPLTKYAGVVMVGLQPVGTACALSGSFRGFKRISTRKTLLKVSPKKFRHLRSGV